MQLNFNDYGYKEWLSADCMRPIAGNFLRVAWQAQKCRLVDIFPLLGDVWPQSTCEQLLALVDGKECFLECKVIKCRDISTVIQFLLNSSFFFSYC